MPVVGSVLPPVAGGVAGVVPHELHPPAPMGDSVADTAGEPVSLVAPVVSVEAHGSVEVQVDAPALVVQPTLGSVVEPEELVVPPPMYVGGGT